MIVDSVFKWDTDSLQQLAAPVYSTRYWQSFEIDDLLPGNSRYKELDSIPEISLPFRNKEDTTAKRSNGVDYYITTRDFFEGQDHYASANAGDFDVCRGYLKNDTLCISIGTKVGFGDSGFRIYMVQGRFTTMPYRSYCVITEDALVPLFAPLWQRLVLSKQSYSLGDSLYGYISFGATYYDVGGSAFGYKANGFFRTVIKKRDW
ncbi:hypothetical protein [Niabella hirudinis]|uniref:hypothetical protein n=1 Tax=Niabella hirudinis TaxID=1285929 RepID=UPI003EB7006C